jgi:23S rRNA pseudoU1915 N3-methylase RlmH
MRLHIIAVGKGRNAPEATLTSDWLSRLPAGGELSEIESKLPAGAARREDEATRILKLVPTDAALVAFDPKGPRLFVRGARHNYYRFGRMKVARVPALPLVVPTVMEQPC